MDYETWQKHKTECLNEAQVSFQRMSAEAQSVMQEAHSHGAIIEVVNIFGVWVAVSTQIWHRGLPHRISPTWPGPAKPASAPEYEDKGVFLVGVAYAFTHPVIGERWLLATAPGTTGFVGYVYEDDSKDKLNPILIFDPQTDGTYRLRVPKAVRFLKGEKA